jgi:signal transduction histidine kinase
MVPEIKWPFLPVCLSEIVDKDTLAALESGCCERLGRPLTILDYDPDSRGFCDRIESIAEKQRYAEFCYLLRDGTCVQGGDVACKQADIRQSQLSLRQYLETGRPFRSFRCHMGLQDMTHVIRIKGRPVALLVSGQYCPAGGRARIRTTVRELGSGAQRGIVPDEAARERLLDLVDKLDPFPQDARARLEREAMHIQGFAEATFDRVKREREEDFLDELRLFIESNRATSYRELAQVLQRVLALVQDFCDCEYVMLFGSIHEGNTVLAPLASVGVPERIAQSLPHFNWRKARLPLERFDIKAADLSRLQRDTGTRGIRGENSRFFDGAHAVMPLCHGDRYRGVLVFGPFRSAVDLQRERRFLTEIVTTVGIPALLVLEVLNLDQERQRWQSTAKLLTHQLRTALTPITTRVGSAKMLVRRLKQDDTTRRADGLLQRAEDMCLRVAETARETLKGHNVQLEREDLELERHPLSVMVTNCAEGFIADAERKHRSLVIHEEVEYLPQAEVDVARLTIALSNLIDNAIKYSFPETTIHIRARSDPLISTDTPMAVIEIDDIGDEIRPEDSERIFEQGVRGLTRAKMGRIPGSGLGLWEARAVIEAHGGQIDVSCKRTSIHRRQGAEHQVIFFVRLPVCGVWDKVA